MKIINVVIEEHIPTTKKVIIIIFWMKNDFLMIQFEKSFI